MARTLTWRRSFSENLTFNGGNNPFSFSSHFLGNGETLIKTIVQHDIALSMTKAPDTDVGLISPLGLILGPSNVSIPASPYSNPQPAGNRWLWWQPMFFRFEYFSAGTPNIWSARMDDNSRLITSESQYKNTTGANLYLWYIWSPSQLINWNTAGMTAFGSVSVTALVMGP